MPPAAANGSTSGAALTAQSAVSPLLNPPSPLFTAGPQFLAFGAAQRVPDPLDYEGPRTESPLCAGVLAHVGSMLRCRRSLFRSLHLRGAPDA